MSTFDALDSTSFPPPCQWALQECDGPVVWACYGRYHPDDDYSDSHKRDDADRADLTGSEPAIEQIIVCPALNTPAGEDLVILDEWGYSTPCPAWGFADRLESALYSLGYWRVSDWLPDGDPDSPQLRCRVMFMPRTLDRHRDTTAGFTTWERGRTLRA
ncbi:MAG: hypothetical protein L0H26_00165 [Microlunatus sp.]|nr:hypothetical protein [Microlunatus sp.]